MSYERNDIIKVKLDRQAGLMSDMYVLHCPYVRLVRHHQTNSDTAMVYVSLRNLDTGRIHPDFAMNLDLIGSHLVMEATDA